MPPEAAGGEPGMSEDPPTRQPAMIAFPGHIFDADGRSRPEPLADVRDSLLEALRLADVDRGDLPRA